MNRTNKELAKIFNDMAAIYELQEESGGFRARAYEDAARVLDNLPEDVTEIIDHHEKLEKIRNIGKSMADKIREYIDTGKVEKYEELKRTVPVDFIELLEVEGIGPKRLQLLRKELGIQSKQDLIDALESGKVSQLKGFGKKTAENMLAGIARHDQAANRILLAEALDIAEEIKKELLSCCRPDRLEVAGSVRRCRPTIGDIDILVTAKAAERKKIMNCFVGMPFVDNVIAHGDKKSSVTISLGHRDADLRIVDEEEFGAAMLYFTGSKAHNVHLRKMAQEKKWKINEYGLFAGDKKLAGKTEESIYKKLGLQWVPPEMREDNGEIELAAEGKIPDLISVKDIKGDLHLHSTWSDGTTTIKELAEFVRKHYRYEYLVVTDHSKSQTQAGGLDEKELRKEFREIDQINKELGTNFIKKGVEVDILADGSLDLSDDLLKECDWVVASVHRRLKQDNTDRLLKAMDNRYVNAIGHPTGRLIGQRDPYPLDMDKVLGQAKRTGTAMEINASPKRMDLESRWARAARDRDVMLVIDTDSHALTSFADMRLGVAVARRAWCTAGEVLNTRGWKGVAAFVDAKR